MKRTSKGDEIEIIKSYKEGKSMSAVGKEFSVTTATVLRILNDYGVEKRTKGGIYPLDINNIIKKYKSGVSTSVIAEECNVCGHTITNVLEKYGIRRDNIYHNFKLDNDYWSKIDTYDKAYFLGFLITDGNIYKNRVALQLNEKDINILKIFSEKTGNTNSIRVDKRNMAEWSLKRKKWVKDLSQYGVIPRKTDTAYMPIIDDIMMPHLLRGIIDGDGWISTKSHQIGLCGTEKLVTQVRDFLVKKLEVYNVKVIHCSEKVWQITWASIKDIKIIGNYLYENKQDCFLERKFNNYMDIINVNTEVSS